MAFLSEQDTTFLQETFQNQMVGDVTIRLFTQRVTSLTVPGFEQQTELCGQANAITEELAALSDKIHLETYDYRADAEELKQHGIERIPSVIVGNDTMSPARFLGVVAGHEFSTLIHDILDLSTNTIELSDETKEILSGLEEDVHLQVFVTPT